MATFTEPEVVTTPGTSYVKVIEHRTARIQIHTPKNTGGTTSFSIEVTREHRESRDGVYHSSQFSLMTLTIAQVMLCAGGAEVMGGMAAVIDAIAATSGQ